MAINVGEVETYGLMIKRVQGNSGRVARGMVKGWLKAHPNWEAADLRAAAALAVSQTVADYSDYTASLACDLYDSCMAQEGAKVAYAEPWTGNSDDQIAKAVRYQMQKALDGDIDAFLDAIDEMTQYYVRLAANNTTIQNVERDNNARIQGAMDSVQGNRRYGNLDMPTIYGKPGQVRRSQPRRRTNRAHIRRVGDIAYSRVPTGLETCSYCMMLASRGFVYHSAESAGHADHRGCDCMIVPGRYGMSTIDGIDLDAQYDCWRELEAIEAYAKKNPDGLDKAELEKRKKEIVGRYDKLTLATEAGEVRKHLSQGVVEWYEPRERMAKNYSPDNND